MAFASRKHALNPSVPNRIPARPAALGAALAALLLLLFAGCSDNEKRLNYSYLRSPAQFQVDTASTDMGCDDPGPNFSGEGEDASATCRSLRKYVLSWEAPDDTVKFKGYRLYLDTTPPPAGKSWRATQGDDREAAIIIPWSGRSAESLVFFFFDGRDPPPGIRASPAQDTLYPGKSRVFGLDSSGRLEETLERFVFALATRFSEGTQGQPQYLNIITGDKLRPMPFQPALRPGSHELSITWSRPRDMVSDFNRAIDTGIIAGYVFTLKLYGGRLRERANAFNPAVRFIRGGDTVEGDFLDSVLTNPEGIQIGRQYYLPDGGRAGRGAPTLRDSLALRVTNLVPEDSLDVTLYALDSAGNDNLASMPGKVTVILTDTTQPTKPELAVIDSLTTQNRFVLEWTASRDTEDPDGDGRLEPAAAPNHFIARYLLARTLLPGPGGIADAVGRRDTVIEITAANRANERFRYTVDFLPPGKAYLLTLSAVDSSGFASATDSAIAATDSIRFAGADSGLACPPGFIPIPSARFQFGETLASGDPDEKGPDGKARLVRMQSYCIEPYEHRDSAGAFVTRVTWDEADRICREMSPADSSRLCSEAQWERACEGFNADGPHPHGIQSENDPSILQAYCNQATGDSVMAMSFDKRHPICLTNEGVFDMAGNLTEWVRDVYDSAGIADLKDTVLGHGFSFAGSGSGAARPHAVRGGNFLKLDQLTLAKAQSLARCSNRDFPAPIRPKVRRDCVDPDHPMVAVVYGGGLDNFRCFGLPDRLQGAAITDVRLDDRDSSLVRIFVAGQREPDTARIPLDTAFRGRRPQQVLMTPQSLAEVAFELVADPDSVVLDTLDAGEMRFASEADLKRILDRESPSRAWTPRKADGRIAIRKLYAYALSGTKPAKPYMASRTIGFRCCALPRPKATDGVTEDPLVDATGSPAGAPRPLAGAAKRSAR